MLIFSVVLTGYVFAFLEKERKDIETGLNKYLYYIALPFTLFLKTSSLEPDIITFNFFAVNTFPIIFIYILVYIMWKMKVLNSNFLRTLAITSTLGNLIYLGLVVIAFSIGDNMVGTAAVVAVIQNLVIFTLGIFLINIICDGDLCSKIIFSKIIKNPLMISSVSGLIWAYLSFPVSDFIYKFLEGFSKSTTFLALFSIGIGLYGKKIHLENIEKILIIFVFKMILLPFIVFIWIYFTGEMDISYKVVFIQYTMPVAVACYVLAYEFDLEYDVVAQSILFTTIMYFILYPFYNNVISMLF